MASDKIFYCPVNSCNKLIYESPQDMMIHIKSFHPNIFRYLKFPEEVFRCDTCEKFTKYQHIHCSHSHCHDIVFRSIEDLIKHNNENHKYWQVEEKCKKEHCKGFGCTMNHHFAGHLNYQYVDDRICQNDKPWETKRCQDPMCRKEHFAGHFRELLKMEN